MTTRLSQYADGVMEAAWLAAVLLTPVFFDIYSSRIFEPDKITLLRTLALVTLAAWLVKLYEAGGVRWERISPDGGVFNALRRIPLILPVALFALVYLIAVIFSITPFTSLWGSYQRLQGFYTTLSYLTLFAALAANLRRRAQLERVITIAILASLPVSLYGILQHYGADPIPWGGDVSGRIAANLGNSIFVAAYLIMVYPLALLRTVEAFEALLVERGPLLPNFTRSTAYVFILALLTIAIYFSGSRGPWLGWGASLVVIWLGLSLIWRKRWLTISGVALALFAGGFIVLLNLPGGPLESLRDRPEFGRLGQLLDAESRTGRVRTLIWQGAAELVLPHAPLEFPDGRADAFNALRPLIGYGPESMYVAYNRFYPPELTQVEKRNASPDRSHNETWDALATSGVLGLAAYLALFGAILYYGLKWLGLVPGRGERSLFLALYLLGGLVSSVGFVRWGGLKLLGVALPFGMVAGVALYLILISLFGRVQEGVTEIQRLRAYALLGLLAAILAHFVEINFGIAIAATRLYFWFVAALLLLAGYILPRHEAERPSEAVSEPAAEAEKRPKPAAGAGRRKGAPRRAPGAAPQPVWLKRAWLRPALITGLIVGLLLATLGYEFVTNASRAPSALGLVLASLTGAAGAGGRNGILPLTLTTWLIGAALVGTEAVGWGTGGARPDDRLWLKTLLGGAALALALGLVCWLWGAGGLAALTRSTARTLEDVLSQVRASEGILTTYYIQVFLFVFALALVLPREWAPAAVRTPAISPLLAGGALALALGFGAYSNLRVIQADIAFKTGDLFARSESWQAAIAIYNRANELAPNEDYYYLFLGRAYLEYAKTLDNPQERDRLIEQAARDLQKAQEINPLNTDHTANLARLYSLWTAYTDDPALRQARADESEAYFAQALSLSPNNARLWDEWAALYLNVLRQPEQAFPKLETALKLDADYDWTHALLGDYYNQLAGDTPPSELQIQRLGQAARSYFQALEKGAGSAAPDQLRSYALALGGARAQLGDLAGAIQAYAQALALAPAAPDRWRIQLALAQFYHDAGQDDLALQMALAAQAAAPEEQQADIRALIAQFGGQQ